MFNYFQAMILNDAEMNANECDQNPTWDGNQQINVDANPNQLAISAVVADGIVVVLIVAAVVAMSYRDTVAVAVVVAIVGKLLVTWPRLLHSMMMIVVAAVVAVAVAVAIAVAVAFVWLTVLLVLFAVASC